MDNNDIRVKTTQSFKLKDKVGRQYKVLPLEKLFGFAPETIIIEKVHGQNNQIVVRAVLTDEEIKREEELRNKVLEAAKGGQDEKNNK